MYKIGKCRICKTKSFLIKNNFCQKCLDKEKLTHFRNNEKAQKILGMKYDRRYNE